MKKCYNCLRNFNNSEISENFYKDSSKPDGYTTSCKQCKNEYDKKRNLNRKYKNLSDHIKRKYQLRSKAKSKFKDSYKCSVIGCDIKAELHHINYRDNSSVLPICRNHHSRIHSLENDLEDVINNKNHADLEKKLKSQNKTNKQLQERLKEAEKVIEFYGDGIKTTIADASYPYCSDYSLTDGHFFFGKRAREYQKKYLNKKR